MAFAVSFIPPFSDRYDSSLIIRVSEVDQGQSMVTRCHALNSDNTLPAKMVACKTGKNKSISACAMWTKANPI